jgi:hypothetical protein
MAAMLAMSPNTERVYRQALITSNLWDGAVDAQPALDKLRRAVKAPTGERCATAVASMRIPLALNAGSARS